MLKRSQITEITDLFNINEVEYRKLITLFIDSDCYINEMKDVLSFNHLISTQDVVKQPLKRKSKLKLKQLVTNSSQKNC